MGRSQTKSHTIVSNKAGCLVPQEKPSFRLKPSFPQGFEESFCLLRNLLLFFWQEEQVALPLTMAALPINLSRPTLVSRLSPPPVPEHKPHPSSPAPFLRFPFNPENLSPFASPCSPGTQPWQFEINFFPFLCMEQAILVSLLCLFSLGR